MDKKLMYKIFPNLLAKAISDNQETIEELRLYVDDQDKNLHDRIDNLYNFVNTEFEALEQRVSNNEDSIVELHEEDTKLLQLINTVKVMTEGIKEKYDQEIPSIKRYVENQLAKTLYEARLPSAGIAFNTIPSGGNMLFSYTLPEDGIYVATCDFSSTCQKEYLMQISLNVGSQFVASGKIYNFPNYPSALDGTVTAVFQAQEGVMFNVGVNLWHASSVTFESADTIDGNTTLKIWRLN